MARKTPWQKEWNNLLKKEAKYRKKRVDGPTSLLLQKLDRFIPEKLSGTLAAAFFKAFQVIFEKGTRLIELTYNRKKKQADFMVNNYANEMYGNIKTARSFTKDAKGSRLLNMIISFVEGVVLGLLGLGIPDIPLFMAIVLKGVYEQLNEAIDIIASDGGEIGGWSISKEDQMRLTSDSLSKEMLYTKFIQGWTILGVFGGIFDPVYVNRITKYALLKYRRRFLATRLKGESIER